MTIYHSPKRFLAVLSGPLAVALASACIDGLPSTDGETGLPEVNEYRIGSAPDAGAQDDAVTLAWLEVLASSGIWELAAQQPQEGELEMDAELPSIDPSEMSAEELAEAYEAALNDPFWYANDGERYDALFLTPEGLLFGRRGEAPESDAPTEDASFGAFEGVSEVESQSIVPASLIALRSAGGAAPPSTPSDSVTSEAPEPLHNYVTTNYANDDRLRVFGTSTLTSYPYRVVGALSGSGATSDGTCTGAKIGPRAVLTASHCVMDLDGPLRRSGKFNPGQTNAAALNGSIDWSGLFWRDWRIDHKFDYAVLFLADSQAVVNLGWMGATWWNNSSGYDGLLASNLGYPCGPSNACGAITSQRCAASPRVDKRCDGWMYGEDDYLGSGSYLANDLLEFYNDVSDGHSGSPVFAIVGGATAVLAVAAWCEQGAGQPCNGARFRQSMWDDVCSWIAAAPSAYGNHALCN